MKAFLRTIHSALLAAVATCVVAQTPLVDGQPASGNVTTGNWAHYSIDVPDWKSKLSVNLTVTVPASANRGFPLYVRYNASPNLTEFDFRPVPASRNSYTLDIDGATLKSGRYHISVYGYVALGYTVKASMSAQASSRPGMGAKPYSGGSMFRVWAPFAESVTVAGQFNGWNGTEPRLVSEGNGHWSLDYRNAIPGQQYRYVIRRGTQTIWRKDPREEEATNSVGNSVIFDDSFPWTDGGFQMPAWNKLVVYEMHAGTFNDTPGGLPGTLGTAITKLDHLQDLGVNAISLMPVNEFPGDFSWGYNPSLPFAVEQAYGGPRALKRFVDAAHARGIAVLLDIVHNHYGPTDLDLWQFDGWYQGNYGGIYFYQDNRSFTPWGNTRPDFGRPEVRQFIRDNALMWLQDFHFDGLRWDSTLNIRSHSGGDIPEGWSLMQWVNNEIDAAQPWKINIAEDMQGNSWLTKDSGAGGAGFDSQWTAQFVHPIRSAIIAANDNDRDMNAVRNALAYQYSGDAFESLIYTESHDEVANGRSRVPEEIWPGNAASWFSRKRSTLGAALVMTSPAIPMLFQGQEFLEDGFFSDADPLDWTKLNTYSGINLMYRDLIRLRRNWFDTTRGLSGHHTNVHHVNNGDKVIAFHRWDQGGPKDDVVILSNFKNAVWSNYRIGLPRAGTWKVRFNSDWNGYSSDFGNTPSPDVTADNNPYDGMPFSASLQVGPYSTLILSQD